MKPGFENFIPEDEKKRTVSVRVPETLYKNLSAVAVFSDDLTGLNDLFVEGAIRVLQDRMEDGVDQTIIDFVQSLPGRGASSESQTPPPPTE